MCLYTLLVAYYGLMQHIVIPTDNSSFSSLCRCVKRCWVRIVCSISSHLHVECNFPPFSNLSRTVRKWLWLLFLIFFFISSDPMTHRVMMSHSQSRSFPVSVFLIISHSVYCAISMVRFKSKCHQHLQGKGLSYVHYLVFKLHPGLTWTTKPDLNKQLWIWYVFCHIDLCYRSAALCSHALLAMVDCAVCSHATQLRFHHHIDICSWPLTHGWWGCFTSHWHTEGHVCLSY